MAQTRLLDSPPEASFDRLTRLASRLLDAPIALVSLVDTDRQFIKSQVGLGEPWATRREMPLSHSFCRHVVASGRPLCVGDAPNDPRVCDNPAITDMNVAAYLGVPLVTHEGHVLGAFCVLDGQPRAWTSEQQALLRDLADSVQTEIVLRQAARLAEREHREKAVLLDSAEQGILGTDANGHCTFVNPAAGRRLGYAPHELIGRDLHALVHPRWPDGSPCFGNHCPLGHAIQNGLRGRFDDLALFCRDGAAFPAIVTCAPTALSDERAGETSEIGDATAMVVSFLDITERQRAEQRLRAQYAVSRVLAEAETLDGDNTVPRLLEAVARAGGWNCAALWRVQDEPDEPEEQNELGRLRCAGVWHAPAHPLPDFLAATQQHTLRAGQSLPGRVLASGAPAWVTDVSQDAGFLRRTLAQQAGLHGAFAFPVLGASGTVLGVMEYFSHDIRPPDPDLLDMARSLGTQIGQFVERKQAEVAARASEARKAAVVEAALDCIITIDHMGRIVEFNPAAEATFGHRRQDILGRDMAEVLLPPAQRQDHRRGLAHYLATGEGPILGVRQQMTALRSDGTEFPVDLTVTRLGTEGAPLFTGFVRDITGRKRAEAAVGRILSQLRASANAQRESEQLLRTVIREVPLILFALDRNGVFTLSEGRGLEALGLHGGEVVGRSVFEVYRDFPDLLQNVRRALAGEISAWITELAGMTFDTRCTLVSEAANDEPTGLIAVAFDITEQKRAEHVARGQTQALTRALDALATRPEFDRFVEQVLAAVAEQLQSPSAALSFCAQNDMVSSEAVALRLVYDRGQVFSPYDAGADLSSAPLLLLSREPELWDDLVRTRRPLVVRNVAQDPRVRNGKRLLSQHIHSLLLVPLLARDSVVGCLSIHGDAPRDFRPEEQELARALAQQAVLAGELTRLAEHEQEAAVLEERNRLAGEIHDTLAQGFTGILLQLEAAQDVLACEPATAGAHITRARDLARSSLVEARRSVAALRPAALERDGLFGALKRQVEQMTAGSPIKTRVIVEGTPRRLPADTEHGLLRIGQEAVHNALKYSQARELRITLAYEPGGIRLRVHDDGQGFDVDRPVIRGSGFGLTFMRERAKQIGARLSLRSAPGQGTEVIAKFPGTNLPETNDVMTEITHEHEQPDPHPDHG